MHLLCLSESQMSESTRASSFPEANTDSLYPTLSWFLPVPSCLQNSACPYLVLMSERRLWRAGREIRLGRQQAPLPVLGVPVLAELGGPCSCRLAATRAKAPDCSGEETSSVLDRERAARSHLRGAAGQLGPCRGPGPFALWISGFHLENTIHGALCNHRDPLLSPPTNSTSRMA